MDHEGTFEAIWQQYRDFHFEEKQKPEPEPQVPPECEYAQAFRRYGQEVCHAALQQPSHITINQAYLQVTKKYWEYFYVVPKQHRYRIGDRGHRCIHFVLQEFSELLKRAELTLQPPMLFIPPPPAPPAPPPVQITKVYKYDGYPIGEVVEEDDEEDE